MKAKRLLLVVLLCVLVLVALLLTTTAASASRAPRAQFGAHARGDAFFTRWCLGCRNTSRRPVVASQLTDRVCIQDRWISLGKAPALRRMSWIPGNVSGSVEAAWTHEGVSYELRARLYDTPVTKTFFRTEGPFLFLFVGLGPAGAELSYSGTLAVGAERSHVEGTCEIGAEPQLRDLLMSFVFNLPGTGRGASRSPGAKDGGG